MISMLFVLATPAMADDQQVPAAGSGGIQPVSPDQFAQKVNTMIDGAYKAAGPVTDAVAKIMLAVAGVAALLVLLSGMKLFQKVVGAVLSIGFGILLFYGAPYIVGLVKGLAQYVTR
ncbi:type IV secretory pathway VirB2 component (pilin) [Desulfofundulus luciae]|uniref:Type IV secretory pathway VirB2 component (Pilin) n=1 Tax=Desulfofundulus luciae TaxID=74702 RepID=A0ABU0B758_9FIRM|nr:type IV secretory pathway VirB2 component (pilin) [Desulfofundulus luciae]